jgi:anhydro-N-acetylmuramic acid kinase
MCQHHDGNKVSDVKAWSGAIIAYISGHNAVHQCGIKRLYIGALVNVASCFEDIQKLRTVLGHFSLSSFSRSFSLELGSAGVYHGLAPDGKGHHGGLALMEKGFTALGLMSGTSLDGVDGAIIRSDGTRVFHHGPVAHLTYSHENREVIEEAIAAAARWPGGPEPQPIYRASALISDTHARLVKRLLETANLWAGDIDFIGFHGQTILHKTQSQRTVQIGDAQALADLTGIDVVADFRLTDVEAGGQGAPLAPLYHQALVRSGGNADTFELPIAVLNIGGVGNVTYIDGDEIVAFDTGPGNGLIDEWMARHTSRTYDEGGQVARVGTIDLHALETMLENKYFKTIPPKSLDRYDFRTDYVSRLGIEDGAATLTAFTAASIARCLEHLPGEPNMWVVCGGGRHNETLMDALDERLKGSVVKAEAVGWRGDELEAEAFGFLAIRSYLDMPLSLPSTTGVPQPCSGGKLYTAMR